jgi:hypothetical protein
VCFVLGLFLMPETRHNSIWAPAAEHGLAVFRLARLPYFLASLCAVLILAAVSAVVSAAAPWAVGMVTLLALIATALSFVLTLARLHDIGYSGWWSLLLFVPVVGFVVWVWLCLAPSDEAREPAEARAVS